MRDATIKRVDEMETFYDGLVARARAELGVTSWGMQLFDYPPGFDQYPNHNHAEGAVDPGQEELYLPLAGSGTLHLDGEAHTLEPLTEPHARELHLHCYRMLGSTLDAEDALQETLLRAWKSLGRFEPRAPFRAWLYKIATNVCLSAAGRSASQSVPYPMNADGEALLRTPYPDAWLDELRSEPEMRYDLHEGVQLAFLAATQVLPPRQRAVLLLRDVLGFAADEVAELIDASTASVNSALQRARATLDRWRAAGRLEIGGTPAPDDVQRSLLRRSVEAWEAVDLDGLLRLLREDAVMTMPPSPLIFEGSDSIVEFLATVPAEGRLDEIALLPTRANGQPAVGAYLGGQAYGLMVLTIDGEEVAEITGFTDAKLFPDFGLPTELSSQRGTAP